MEIDVYVISIAFGVVFLVLIIELVRKGKLMEKYSLLWILFGILLLILSSTPFFIEKIAGVLGIKYAPSVLFLFGLVYLVLYSLHLTTVVSSQSEKITRLNQELALLKDMVENLKERGLH